MTDTPLQTSWIEAVARGGIMAMDAADVFVPSSSESEALDEDALDEDAHPPIAMRSLLSLSFSVRKTRACAASSSRSAPTRACFRRPKRCDR